MSRKNAAVAVKRPPGTPPHNTVSGRTGFLYLLDLERSRIPGDARPFQPGQSPADHNPYKRQGTFALTDKCPEKA